MDRGDRVLGLSTERVSLGRESALKVVSVTPNSPAANAGIEPGDILVKANGIALESDRQLAQSYRESGGQFALTVRDVRSGRDVLVNIESDAAVPNSDPSIDLNMKAKPLGVTTALAFYGGEPVLKVTEVASGSPAERAGITIGLLILKANGQPTSSEEKLREAERGSRGRLELQVVDPSDRRERTVRVTL